MITDPNDYFTRGCGRCDKFDSPACKVHTWAEGLAVLRDICRDLGLSETAKWGHPTYMHAGRNICILGAFKDNYRLTFMNAGLMKDPDGVLQKRGPNTQSADMLVFDDPGAAAKAAPLIRAYLAEAMGYAEQGLKDATPRPEVDLPEELVQALDNDPELAEAFAALTPGRQRSYALNLAAAKQPQTRINRIEKFRPKIIAGKGATERMS